jgi:hypothetical protein
LKDREQADNLELMFEPDDPRPWGTATDDDLVAAAQGLQAQRSALDAAEAELLMEVEHRRIRQPSAHRDTAAWLRVATGVARSTARCRVEVARQLAHLPAAHAALARGRVGFDHVRTLADHANSPNRDVLLESEYDLVRAAEEQPADRFRDAMAGWARDLEEQREQGCTPDERQRRRRRWHTWRTREGMNAGRFELDDEAFAVVNGLVKDVVAEERRAERGVTLPPEAQRTAGQRGADALVEMARRARGADVITKHRARPTILAITDMSLLWDQLRVNGVCELADGRKITARQLRRLACEADVIPIVLDSDGVVLDMGRRVRLATEDQRRALRAMHASCAVSDCDVPFDWCEIHHLKPWERGGRTDLDNLVPLCTYHHHLVHDAAWPVEVLPDRQVRLLDHGRRLRPPTLRSRPRPPARC